MSNEELTDEERKNIWMMANGEIERGREMYESKVSGL